MSSSTATAGHLYKPKKKKEEDLQPEPEPGLKFGSWPENLGQLNVPEVLFGS